MRSYSREDILEIYSRFVKVACNYAHNKKWLKASNVLSSAAYWAYQFNSFYRDDEAEGLIKVIGESQVKPAHVTNAKKNRIVLIDSFCFDNRGLTQQYLRAFIQSGVDFLYVCTADTVKYGEDILKELDACPSAQRLTFDGARYNVLEVANVIANRITEYAPAHVFLHIAPWDVAALTVCSVIHGVTVYNINLTDHAYWMGASIIDYNIEFRPYGKTVSLEKRGLKTNQLLTLPFYPVAPIGHPFRGFPHMPEGAVKVFTGGAVYKMLGKDDAFFHMMEEILSLAPNVYIIVAGFNYSPEFDEKCSKIADRDRILQIGFRDDIDAVFQESDIYLSTYPISGGLMCQYAAKYGKPILAYREASDQESAVEEMLNHYDHSAKSFTDLNDMLEYARRLISDKRFREEEGRSIRNGLMTPERFQECLSAIVSTHEIRWDWALDVINYDAFANHYLALENETDFPTTKYLVRTQLHSLPMLLRVFRGRLISIVIELAFSRILRKKDQQKS